MGLLDSLKTTLGNITKVTETKTFEAKKTNKIEESVLTKKTESDSIVLKSTTSDEISEEKMKDIAEKLKELQQEKDVSNKKDEMKELIEVESLKKSKLVFQMKMSFVKYKIQQAIKNFLGIEEKQPLGHLSNEKIKKTYEEQLEKFSTNEIKNK